MDRKPTASAGGTGWGFIDAPPISKPYIGTNRLNYVGRFDPPEVSSVALDVTGRTTRDSGRRHLDLFHNFGIEVNVRAEVLALPPGHPYLRLPLQFATSLEKRLLLLVSTDHLERLRSDGEAELREPGRWGTTFTLIQCWGRVRL